MSLICFVGLAASIASVVNLVLCVASDTRNLLQKLENASASIGSELSDNDQEIALQGHT